MGQDRPRAVFLGRGMAVGNHDGFCSFTQSENLMKVDWFSFPRVKTIMARTFQGLKGGANGNFGGRAGYFGFLGRVLLLHSWGEIPKHPPKPRGKAEKQKVSLPCNKKKRIGKKENCGHFGGHQVDRWRGNGF